MNWRPVLSVPCFSPNVSRDRLQTPVTPGFQLQLLQFGMEMSFKRKGRESVIYICTSQWENFFWTPGLLWSHWHGFHKFTWNAQITSMPSLFHSATVFHRISKWMQSTSKIIEKRKTWHEVKKKICLSLKKTSKPKNITINICVKWNFLQCQTLETNASMPMFHILIQGFFSMPNLNFTTLVP